jgi:fructose/tagatose bisphosphate aldolase
MAVEHYQSVADLLRDTHDVVHIGSDGVTIADPTEFRTRLVDRLVYSSVFGDEEVQQASRWLIRAASSALDAWTASIHDLYMAAGRMEYAGVTTPAINVRGLTYDLARTIFQAAHRTQTKQVIFELARSEMGYTFQRPGEYATSILAAAIKESWTGPVFIQGDHYQANAKKYADDPAKEIGGVRDLIGEAVHAGYGNIDIDSSTLVDLSKETLSEQQRLNYVHTAELTQAVREAEFPGLTVSVGGEIGEVGKSNSTVEELEAFVEGYQKELARRSNELGRELVGMSKVSVQTGTSHGGVVLPDGSIKEVSVDFATLAALSAAAKEKYGIGGAVQHGASTLPEEAFSKFAEANAVEVHLATAFQNVIFDSEYFPDDLRQEIYAYLAKEHASERKPDQTDSQFTYTTRKQAFGPFKQQFWNLPDDAKSGVLGELRPRFELIFKQLNVAGQGHLVDKYIRRVDTPTEAPASLTHTVAR